MGLSPREPVASVNARGQCGQVGVTRPGSPTGAVTCSATSARLSGVRPRSHSCPRGSRLDQRHELIAGGRAKKADAGVLIAFQQDDRRNLARCRTREPVLLEDEVHFLQRQEIAQATISSSTCLGHCTVSGAPKVWEKNRSRTGSSMTPDVRGRSAGPVPKAECMAGGLDLEQVVKTPSAPCRGAAPSSLVRRSSGPSTACRSFSRSSRNPGRDRLHAPNRIAGVERRALLRRRAGRCHTGGEAVESDLTRDHGCRTAHIRTTSR